MSSIPAQLGNYRLDREIGRGATSEVWLAHHRYLEDRHVAIKVLMSHDRDTIRRFTNEANIASRLHHPNIVQAYDYGYTEPFYYTVFEHIHGNSLRQLLEQQQHLSIDDALNVFRQAAAALDYAHSQKIVHRDVSPGNILIEQGSGRTLITDFGIARDPGNSITVNQIVMGTPGYFSPEHMQSATAVTHLSDIYSLGVVLYVMFTGELPWENPPGLSDNLVFEPPLPLRKRGINNVPSDVDEVLKMLMAVDPAKRFHSAQAAIDMLDQIFKRHVIETQIITPGQTPRQASRYHASGIANNPVEQVFASDLLRGPIEAAHKRAEALCDPVVIADLLNAWSQQGRLRQRMLGRLAKLHQVQSHNVYFYRLRVLYEERKPLQETEAPDHKVQVFQVSREQDRWEVELPPIDPDKAFANNPGAQVIVPGSMRVVSCDACAGTGVLVCPRCKGKQRIYAPRPATEQPAEVVEAGVADAAQAARAAARKAAPQSDQVLVPCPECEGRGGFPCVRCDGAQRLIKQKVFQWQRTANTFRSNDDLPDLDERWLRDNCRSEVIYRERQANGFRAEWALVPALKDLVHRAQAETDADIRITLSDLTITFIPVTDILFDLGQTDAHVDESKLYPLAIYGFERHIPPDWRFFNWERVIFACVLGLLLALVVIFGFFAFTA